MVARPTHDDRALQPYLRRSFDVLRKFALRAGCASLGAALLASTAFAYRPFASTDAVVAKPKEFELELGPIGSLRDGPNKYWVAPAVVAVDPQTHRVYFPLQKLHGRAALRIMEPEQKPH